jgi:hypothetical protein
VAAHLRAAVARELDEVERVQDRQSAGEIREEDETRLERADEERLAPLVVTCNLLPELADARSDLCCREIDLANP